MWQTVEWIAWLVSIAIGIWMVWDFFRIDSTYGEDVLLSSREGIDELFGESNPTKRA